jgi:threonyl-tRNA synthetase
MIKITLPDGSVKEFALGVTPMDAKSISEGFARNVISASFNGNSGNNLFDGGWQSYLIYME